MHVPFRAVMKPRPASLLKLRHQVDRTDRAITTAIGRRLRLAHSIGRTKRDAGISLRDFATEDRVLRRWRTQLRAVGVTEARSEALARWMIEESLRVQESIPGRARKRRPPGERIGVVGGSGGMGRWLVEFLTDSAHEVRILDPRASPADPRTMSSLEEMLGECQMVAFATPIRATPALLEQAIDSRPEAVLFDVLSVKAPIVPIVEEGCRRGCRISSAHPMFGPSARTLSGRNLLLVSCGVREADAAVRALFTPTALTITEVPLARHDRLIAESLGLAHAVNLLFLSALASDPMTPLDLATAASTTFHRQSSLAAAVAREGPELYLDIQSLNPHSGEVYSELRAALDRLVDIVERKDLGEFRALLESGRSKLETGPEPMRA